MPEPSVPRKVLLIEDRVSDARLVIRQLRKAGLEVESARVASEAELLAALERPVDVILADYNLPGFDVRRALELAKSKSPDTPFLIVSGTMQEETGVELMRLGADDYLLKDRLARLGQAVEQAIEQRKRRREQRAMENRYRRQFDESPAGMMLVAPNGGGVPIRVNRAFCEMLEYTEGELSRLGIEEVTHPDDRRESNRALTELTDGGAERVRLEKRYLTKSGAVRWGDVTGTVVRDFDGEPLYVQTVVLDITDRKRAEAALHESIERFRGIVEELPGFVYTCAVDDIGTTLYVSPQVEALLGISQAEYVTDPRSWEKAIHPDDRLWVLEAFGKAVSQGLRFEAEYRSVARDGSLHWLRDQAVVIHDRDGQALYCQGVILDVTARRNAEQAVMENEAKTKFLANMSHELRNPLNSVIGFAQLLGSMELPSLSEKQRRYIGHIETAGQHLLALVNDMLDLSKAVAGQMVFDIESVAVDQVIEACLAQMEPQATARSVRLDDRGKPGLVANVDRQRLLQILINLVSNGIKFTPAGGCVSLTRENAMETVRISIEDTGPGIPADKLDYIFDEFAQLERAEPGSQQGTGLGLPLSRRLAELMGGAIEVASRPGRGSSFTVTIPVG